MIDKPKTPGSFRGGIGLRFKIILTFFIINMVVSGFLAASSYILLKNILTRELFVKLDDMTRLGSALIDTQAIEELKARSGLNLAEDKVAAAEQSAAFSRVSASLNSIRDVEKRLIRYVYTFARTDDPHRALFLVDADLLTGNSTGAGEVTHFSSVFDLTNFDKAQETILSDRPTIDDNFVWDAQFQVNSVSGYAPIRDRAGQVVAYLGIDMADKDVQAALADVTFTFSLVAAAAMLLTFLAAILLGTFFTRSIIYLDQVVRRFGEREKNVRASVKSRDEVGRLGHSFNQMAVTIEDYARELEALLEAYGKFVPHDFLRFLDKKSIVEVKLGDQVLREMTILFSDIRSFTNLSETMSPQENFNFLNSYLGRVGPEIRANHGFIDKYIGDAVMGLFPGQAEDGLRAGIAMQRKLVEYNEHRRRQHYEPIAIGVGVHTGNLMLGTIGEQLRMDGTVIADAVNLASRLEGLTKKYHVRILTTKDTLSRVKDASAFVHRFVDRVRVVGKKTPIVIFEIADADPDEEREQKLANRDKFMGGIKLYLNKHIDRAAAIFRDLATAHPEDGLYALYAGRCKTLLASGIPEGWDGVESIDSK
jgi:class 3 adenylate cyclase